MAVINDAQMTLDDLSRDDPVVRQLARSLRDGRGMSLAEAVKELSEIADPARVQAAAEQIQDLADSIQTAQLPRAVVGPGIESWYAGPRNEDRNWPTLVEILQGEGWAKDSIDDLD